MNHKNSVELITYMGNDSLHSLAAWSSTFAEFDIDMPENIENRVDVIVNHILNNGKKKRTVAELLAFLAENEHTSPFRFSSFVFAATTDIATHIQKLKHRVILEAENGESARYKELQEDKMYLPNDWNGIEISDNINEKDELVLDFIENNETWKQVLEQYTNLGNDLYHYCLKDLIPVLGRKRAKESARFFKTYNSQIQADISFNMRSFANFIKLRNSEHAQLEIREIAQQMWDLVQTKTHGHFENTLKVIDERIQFEQKCQKYKQLILELE